VAATIEQICNPDAGSLAEAVRQARLCAETSRAFDLDLSRFLQPQCFSQHLALPVIFRGLEVLEAIVDERKLLTTLRPFLKSSVPQIVSKCVLILGRRCQNVAWMRNVMAENDDRVRANLIESLWKRRDKEIEPILLEAVKDSNHRVAANAVYALFLAGSENYAEGLDHLISSADPAFRRAAVWVVKSAATARNEAAARLKPLILDPDESVRRAAFRTLVFLRENVCPAAGSGQS
jgi:HEAT repeats